MELNFTLNGSIDPVAFYAASLSTIIAIWELKKWRGRNRIEVRCNSNMIFMPSANKKTYIVANVVNKGEFPTTITHLIMYYWKNKLDRVLNRNRQSFLVNSDQVPKIINPGEQWMGQALQDDKIEKMASEGHLYMGVFHTMGKKEILRRIKIDKVDSSSHSVNPMTKLPRLVWHIVGAITAPFAVGIFYLYLSRKYFYEFIAVSDSLGLVFCVLTGIIFIVTAPIHISKRLLILIVYLPALILSLFYFTLVFVCLAFNACL